MVVEDEGVIAMLLSDLLEQLGHEVCAVEATEAGAVAAAQSSNPDLMIVDDRLREGGGRAAVETILLTRRLPYVFVTGDSAEMRELPPGAVMIEKPCSESDLVRAIGNAISHWAALLPEEWPSPVRQG